MKKIIISIVIAVLANLQLNAQIPGRGDINKRVAGETRKVVEKNNTNNQATADTTAKPGADTPTQPAEGPAKGQISTFWKHIEKMRSHTKEDNKQVVYSSGLQGAKSSLNNTKIKDPSYNTAAMEQALAECQAVYDGLGKAKVNTREQASQTLDKLLTFFEKTHTPLLYYNPLMNSSDAAIMELVKANDDSIAKYKRMVMAFISEKQDEMMVKSHLAKVQNVAKSFQEPYDKTHAWPMGLDNDMFHLTDPTASKNMGTFSLVQSVKHKEAYFFAATQIYPNQPDLIKAHENCKKALAVIGNNEQFIAKIKKSENDYLQSVKLPAAKVKDAGLEAEFKKHFLALDYKETVLKINITSTDWTVERNTLTGIVIGRSKQAYIASKNAEGVCYVTEFWIMQDYNGSGYGPFRNITNNSFRSRIACENVK